MDPAHGSALKHRPRVGARDVQPVLNVAIGLVDGERTQVVANRDALPQLSQGWLVEDVS